MAIADVEECNTNPRAGKYRDQPRQKYLESQLRFKCGSSGVLLLAVILASSGTALAQGSPCYSAAQCAQIRQQAEQQQAAQREAQAAAAASWAQQQREQAKADAQMRLQAESQAREAAATRARQAVEDQMDYEDRQRQQARYRADADARMLANRLMAEQEAENRAAAQLAAENSPDNRCHDRKTAGLMLDYFNGLQAAADFNNRAVDIDHLTTLQFDPERSLISCHGSFVLQNGRHVTGSLSTRLNVAGNLLTTFHADSN
jgi:hypothetical protein